jgi:molecular chaperone DnaK
VDRGTIDFGIDLGTTNSSIAVIRGVSTDIIKNNQDADITPSIVGIDKRGAIRVGTEARDLSLSDPENAFAEFKRQMGAKHQYAFKRGGVTKLPEELSAEVLKDLRGNVRQRIGEEIDAAVITVPAAFELHQCDATRKAAELAGFAQSPLLQEPVAAALAYGFQADSNKAYWLVYDFGGGTFDAAVIKAEEGTVRVVNHGGDNFLGGSDIDWTLIEKLIVPRLTKEHGLKDFHRGNTRWRSAFALLKRSIERAKIRLSREEKVWIDECRFQGDNNEVVEPDYELTRGEVVAAAEPIIHRTVDICRRVLEEKRLAPSAVEKLILVGGPTLAPYVRDQLRNLLGIQLEHSVDPLTVVARGAAVFAGTQRRSSSSPTAQKGTYVIDLKYKPVGLDSAPLVGGRISGPARESFEGFSVELVADGNRWRSGKVPVSHEGVFTATLRAERGQRNTYTISLFDATGKRQSVTPDSFTYTVGAVVDEQPLINSMGVALADNEFDRLLERGRGLPARVTRTYASATGLKKGQKGAVLRIPVCEGEARKADRNRHVGTLLITGENIARDLPVHSEIEVTLEMDASRIPRVRAYVPILDTDFEATLGLGVSQRDSEVIRTEVADELKRLRETVVRANAVNDSKGAQRLEAIAAGPLVEELGQLVQNVEDVDAAQKCDHRLLELKCAIDEVADRLEWPRLVADARELLDRLAQEAETTTQVNLKKQAEKLTQELSRAIEANKVDDLRVKTRQGESLYWHLLAAQPAFWVYQFQYIEKDISRLKDQARASRLCDQGRAFLSQNNAEGLKNVVLELWKLMPEDAVEEVKRGYQSGIVRGSA